MPKTTIEDVRCSLARLPEEGRASEAALQAAVAVILRECDDDLHVLLIRRAEREGDPWSGDIAFPGGRIDATDAGPREAAERETLEEVAMRLDEATYLGRLGEIAGHSESVIVSAFVYSVDEIGPLQLNHEVVEAFWRSLATLEETERHTEQAFRFYDEDVLLPATRILDGEGPVLWGMTYRFLEMLMSLLDRKIPGTPGHVDE